MKTLEEIALEKIAKDFKQYAIEDGQTIRSFMSLFNALYEECKEGMNEEEGKWDNKQQFLEDMEAVIDILAHVNED